MAFPWRKARHMTARTAGGVLLEIVRHALSPDFMPHGYCYLWDPLILWLHVISDSLIVLSYYCIPIILIYVIRKRRDLPFNWIFWMFGGFILACGTTHLMEVWNIWHGSYLASGIIKAITAAISVATAIRLVPLVPRAVSIPSLIHLQEKNRKLEGEIAEHRLRDDAVVDAGLRRRATAGITLAVFLISIMGFFSWRSRQAASDEADWVTHSHAVMQALGAAQRHVIETETGARGYALTGNAVLLAHYQALPVEVARDVEALRRLTADNSRQQRRIDVLDPQIGAALKFAEEIVAKRLRAHSTLEESEVVETERLLQAVQGTIQAMEAEESELLNQRTQKTAAARRVNDLVVAAGTLVGVILLLLAGVAIRRQIDIGARARAQLSALNVSLEERVEQRTAALHESQDRLTGIIQSATDAIVTVDDAQRIVLFNTAAEKMFDCPASDAVGEGLDRFVPERFRARHGEHIHRFGETGVSNRAMGSLGPLRGLRGNGEEFPIEASISQIDSGGKKLFTVILRDVTERVLAEEALKESLAASERARKELADQKFALDQHAIVAVTDVQGTITYVNEKFCAISKYSREELIGQNHRILNSGHHPKGFFMQMYHSIARGEVWHGEICNRAKDGSIYWVDTTIVPFVATDGKPRQYVAIRADITERKQAEEALKESLAASERARKELADQKFALDQHAIVAVTDVQGTITYVNEKFCAISKYSREELIGQNHRILNSSHHPKEFFQQMYHSIARGEVWHAEICNRAKDGSIYWVDTTIVPFVAADGKPRQYVAIRADITERKRAEEALYESQERFRLLLDGVKDYAIYMLDPEGHVISWNTGAARMKGYSSEEIIGKHFSCFYTEGDRKAEKPWRELREAVSKGRFEEQMWRVRKDGSAFWASVVITPMYDEGGRLRGFSKVARDITERKRFEDELRETQARMTGIIASAMDSIITVDHQQCIVLFNLAAEKMFRCPAAEAIGNSIERFIPQRFRSGHSAHIRKFGETGVTGRAMGTLGALWAVRADGEEFQIEASISQIESGGKRLFTVILRDVTERKRAEQQLAGQAEELSRQAAALLRSQQEVTALNSELEHRVVERTAQLEAANQELEGFTYSVSHDLRAPLRHIGGFSKILVEEFGGTLPAEAQNHLERIQEGSRRMGMLVDGLLGLARLGRQAMSTQDTAVGEVVKDLVKMLESEGGPEQTVEWRIGNLPVVECDPVLIRQVFQNLISNALKYSRPREQAVI
jgi:PAS domain S-box-containing protein